MLLQEIFLPQGSNCISLLAGGFFTTEAPLWFSCSIVSDSLQLHDLQQTRFPCPLLSFRVCSNSCSLAPSNYLILSPPSPLALFPSVSVFSSVLALHIRWPKYWSFSFSISPSSEYSGFISFSIDCFDLLALQGTLKSLLQYHSSKASILWSSAFFMVQLSYPYMTTGKTVALTI